VKCFAFLRLTEPRDIDRPNQDIYPEGCFVPTTSYIETFVENAALDIKPDRTLMLRFERKRLCRQNKQP